MIEQILSAIEREVSIPLDDPELVAAVADADFRRSLVLAVIEKFEMGAMLDPEGPQAAELAASPEGVHELLANIGPFLAMRAMMSAGLEPSPGPVASVPHPQPAPVDVSDAELETALSRLATSFFIGSCFSEQATVEGDVFVLPNLELATFDIEWTRATDPEGDVPLVTEDDGFSSSNRPGSDGELSQWLKLGRPPAGGDLVSAEGRCTVTVPQQFAHCTFTADEVDTTKTSGDVTFKLTGCTNDVVNLEVAGGSIEAPFVVVGRDADGTRLETPEWQQNPAGEAWTRDTRFKGVVATVDVYLATTVATRGLTITATAAPDSNTPDVPHARTLRPTPEPRFESVSSAQLAEETQVIAGRLTSSFEINQPSVHAHLPQVENSNLAYVEFGDPDVRAADGNEVPHSKAERGYDAPVQCHKYSLESNDGEPLEFASVSGTVRVRYPLEIQTVRLTAAEPERDGFSVEFDGPRVVLTVQGAEGYDYEDPEADDFSTSWIMSNVRSEPSALRAFDADGNRLRPLSSLSCSGDTLHATFWGRPVEVRVLKIVDKDVIELRYDLEPAPLVDEALAGSDDSVTQCVRPKGNA